MALTRYVFLLSFRACVRMSVREVVSAMGSMICIDGFSPDFCQSCIVGQR